MTKLERATKAHADVVATMRAILDEAGDKEFTPEQLAEWTTLAEKKHKLAAAVKHENEVEKFELEAATVVSAPANGDARPDPEPLVKRLARRRGRTYAEMFGAPPRERGLPSLEEFLAAVHSGVFPSGLQAAQFERSGTEGGYSVPQELVMQMLDASLEKEIVRPRCTIEPMTSDTKKIAGWDVSDSSAGAPYGGFSVQWGIGEGAEIAFKTGKLKLMQLTAKKAGLLCEASNELRSDSGPFDDRLSEAIINSIGWGLDLAFFSGTGAGQPRGILLDPALIVVAAEAAQVVDTIVYANLTKMFARMHPSLIQDAVWVANSTTIPQLLALTVLIKNVAGTENVGGSHIPVVTESNGEFKILTRPVLFTEKVPVLGDQGDLLFVALSQYAVGMRKEVSIDRSSHVGFSRDMETYRALVRVDGGGRWNKAYTPKLGSTLSWAVTLAAR